MSSRTCLSEPSIFRDFSMATWLQLINTFVLVSVPLAVSALQRSKRKDVLEDGVKRVEFWTSWLEAMRDANGGAVQEAEVARMRSEIGRAADEVERTLNPVKGDRHLPKFRRWLLWYWPESFLDWYLHLFPYAMIFFLVRLAVAIVHVFLLERQIETARKALWGAAGQGILFLLAVFVAGLMWAHIVREDGRA